uniref:Reverse transcriptase domain-containing protein n=1 Tax=Tanacetum cinerariifolium TaxID=118510 RepID=A0A6L2NLZ3_TANCI|nr:hypothetical protein [Tanacetum cinerariifolium]
MTRSSTKELFTPFKDPKREFRSSKKLFKTLSLDESRSLAFDLFFDLEENSEEEVTETMAETIGSDKEDANEHIEKVLDIEDPKAKFLSKYCPPPRTAKKIKEVGHEDESAVEREEIDTSHPATQAQPSIAQQDPRPKRGAIPTKTAADAKVAIQDMAKYSQKWHNETSRARSTKTSDGLGVIQARLNKLRREIKRVVKDMDPYLDEGIKEVVVKEPFCEVLCMETRRFDGIITIHNEDDSNFRVTKSSTSLNNTSQISPVHAIAPVLPTKEPEYSFSIGYEHLSTTLETESDEVIKSSAKNLVPIPSEYEVTFDDENSSLKFDYIEEFSGELMPTTINSFPRSLENFHANTVVETLPISPIPVKDGDSHREEKHMFTSTDDLMPLGIESDDYDSEGDIHFLEELLVNDSIPLPKNESSYFDDHDEPSFPRPPPKPPDVEFFFDFQPNSRELILAVMNNIDELNEDECFDLGREIDVFTNVEDDDYFSFVFVIRIFLSYLTYPEVSPLLLFARSEDTIFDLGISI